MKTLTSFPVLILVALAPAIALAQAERPPAVPLVTHDPYFSIWSMNDKLTDGPTRHWTGAPEPLTGLIRIDGQMFRWMGDHPDSIPRMPQAALEITPTRSIYRFEQGGIRLEASFLSPLIPSDLDLMSRPVSYITMTCSATDSARHKVQLLFEASGLLAVDTCTPMPIGVAWEMAWLFRK